LNFECWILGADEDIGVPIVDGEFWILNVGCRWGQEGGEEKAEMAPEWNIDRFKNSYKSIISSYFLFMDGVLWLIFKFQPDSLSHIGGSSERTSGLLFSRP
jgi:hypothetical protein